ncbi:D-2-hydroxyacid dehydrogenase [Sutcliffiella horikoshii]|uniref:D-2-hydroxyacid dehydrogenase n=1 Tax=Sutcliffiella horikoshii TaxID=79883 RepID=A0A5D4T9U3_9BACI|nr:D-2-hydroxyacid dehydrogenase [Sutcliffiella horikoshii]TYS70874.1 D-2-hydroxyacid dehydrogenase [Sutcliffiella horikoshii]
MTNRIMLITQNIGDAYTQQIKEIAPDFEVIVGKDKEIWGPHVKDAEIIVGWKKELDNLSLGAGSHLKWIQSWSAGVNSMPLSTLSENGIILTSANGVHAYPISETIFALMLGLTRKIHTYVKQQQQKVWHHAQMNLEIHEKTIGIIGVGEIGRETAKIAKAFRMNVLGVRHSGKPSDYVDEMYTPDRLHEVLPKCDYVVVTLPLTEETEGMFGREEFNRMKKSAFLINIGRGEVIVENELVHALQGNVIAGAGLDVFINEPLNENSPLWDMNNVIITPHTSGSTEYYSKRVIEDIFIPNLKHYIKNEKPLINVVDYKKGY